MARVRAVNRFAILRIGPVVAFLSDLRALSVEIRAVQSSVIIGNCGMVTFFYAYVLLDLVISLGCYF